MAETIENNVRRLIIDEMAVNPRYYETMSELLDSLIRERKDKALKYKDYLEKIVTLTRKIAVPPAEAYPPTISANPALRALYDNLRSEPGQPHESPAAYGSDSRADATTQLVLALDSAIQRTKKADWRGNRFKEREVRGVILQVLGGNEALADTVFEIVKHQREY